MKKYALSAVSMLMMQAALAQWQPQNAGFSNDTLGFYEMSLPDSQTAWAICYDGKGGLISNRLVLDFTRTIDGGATWVAGKMGTDTTLKFSNISAVSRDEAWVAMHKRAGSGGGLYHTTDGGVTWNQSGAGQIFDASSFPDFVHFRDKNNGVAMGDPNGGYFEIYTTSDGGATWNRVTQAHLPPTLSGESGWISGFYAVGNSVWFGTTAGRVWRSVNFGADWTAHVADSGGGFINEIAFNDDKLHGVAHLRNSRGTYLFATSDGGVTWSNLDRPANWKRSRITAVPGTNALISTSVVQIDPGSSVSFDNGKSWKSIDNSIFMAVSRFYNERTGYAGSFFITGPPFNPGIYKSKIDFKSLTVNSGKTGGSKAADFANVYPTLANELINVSLQGSAARTASVVHLLDMAGKVVETNSFAGKALIQLDVSRLTPGQYTLRITNAGRTMSRAVTIVR